MTEPRRRRGWPLLAWLVIAALAGLIVVRQAWRQGREVASRQVTLRIQARYLVGLKSLKLPGVTTKQLEEAMQRLDHGDPAERLRVVVLAGELVGPAEALRRLARLEGDLEPSDEQAQVAGLLRRLYAGYETDATKPILAQAEQEELVRRLDWFGELAVAPEGGDPAARRQALAPARRTTFAFLALGLGVLAGVGLGGTLLCLVALLAAKGLLAGGLEPGAGNGGIYAETFALYMLVYLGLGLLLLLLPRGVWDLGLQGGIMLASLLVLGWPLLRGVGWRQLRGDLGLHGGARPAVEGLVGLGAYVCAVPVLLVGLLVMVLLLRLRARLGLGDDSLQGPGAPSHPVVGVALSSNPWVWVQLAVVACVVAPLVEEVMFRGVLYRHLREATGEWQAWLSVACSAAATGFVFAVIHPQGWLGVPVLMGLAVVFALVREWRRSLLSAVVAHGVNNGVTLLLLLTTAG